MIRKSAHITRAMIYANVSSFWSITATTTTLPCGLTGPIIFVGYALVSRLNTLVTAYITLIYIQRKLNFDPVIRHLKCESFTAIVLLKDML